MSLEDFFWLRLSEGLLVTTFLILFVGLDGGEVGSMLVLALSDLVLGRKRPY